MIEITNYQLLWHLNVDQITGLLSEENVIRIAVESEASSHFSEYAAEILRLTLGSLPHAPTTIIGFCMKRIIIYPQSDTAKVKQTYYNVSTHLSTIGP